jgi:ribosomal protein S18 acetylase RimI-like enzyme
LNLVFTSKAMKDARPALEELFFFNPRQYRVRDGIVGSLGEFGHPRIEETAEGLSIRVGNREAQTLFAIDPDRRNHLPIGVVIFIRTSPADIAIVHLAVHPDYALPGRRAGQGLALMLIDKVREIASRIVGVQRIVLCYRREIVIRIR